MLDVQSSYQNGMVRDWDDFESVFTHTCFNELRVTPEDIPIIWLASPKTPAKQRDKIAELLFETYGT